MKTIQFKCKLLTDVILAQKAATEGNQESLTFIPGNNFLGIVAKEYNKFSLEEQTVIFHSGHVRFSDAHPTSKEGTERSLHVPAALYYPKLSNLGERCYVSLFYSRKTAIEETGQAEQLKQCRQGYYLFNGNELQPVDIDKNFVIKSAYDRELRKSSDSQMFGYESLEKGTEFLFDVEMDDESLAPILTQALIGTKHIGRSRTAQYGLVEISPCPFKQPTSTANVFRMEGAEYITVYADGRLIFLDEDGEPTFRPTAPMLGLEGEIDWEKSQVRTFQYAPWNGKRQTRDSDRIGIEKGSVFVVKLSTAPKAENLLTYVGSYQNEGFGKVIYGWKLLQESGANGLVALHLTRPKTEETNESKPLQGTPLLNFLGKKQKAATATVFIYEQVNKFVKKNKNLFNKARFASQWGTIRNIAIQNDTMDAILYELFDKEITKEREATPMDNRTQKKEAAGYITHGIKAKEWKVRNRAAILKDFIQEMGTTEKFGDLSQRALVNLSSEMAKKQRSNEDDNI